MTTTKNPNGSYTVSEIVNGYLVSRTYYGYTKRDAIRIFKNECVKEKTK
jgi:hypothetical protein